MHQERDVRFLDIPRFKSSQVARRAATGSSQHARARASGRFGMGAPTVGRPRADPPKTPLQWHGRDDGQRDLLV